MPMKTSYGFESSTCLKQTDSCSTFERHSFTVGPDTFQRDGRPFRYVSGSVHYFKVPRAYWRDRLTRLRASGANALQTYVQWSEHQPEENVTDFSGQRDLEEFVRMAQELGLLVILRPGPYIDAERDLGGLPYWLLRRPGVRLRTSDPRYMSAVTAWYEQLLPRLRPQLYVNGGPVIMVQVENEYGSYPACDAVYTAQLRDLLRKHLGDDVVLFTTDGGSDYYLKCGPVADVFATVDFDTNADAEAAFEAQRRHNAIGGPRVNSEFYPGWINHWGYPRNTVSTQQVVNATKALMALGASFNFYMMHGGTSFGFAAGANMGDTFEPCTTSYDFDAPISENGNTTDKLLALRELIYPYTNMTPLAVPDPLPVVAYGAVAMTWQTGLLQAVSQLNVTRVSHSAVVPFCDVHQAYGFVAYSAAVTWKPTAPAVLDVPGLRDRAYVWVDGRLAGVLTRQDSVLQLPVMADRGSRLTLLVESLGRLCYGDVDDRKGLMKEVTLGGRQLNDWNVTTVPQQLTQLVPAAPTTPLEPHQPALYRGQFNAPSKPADTFLHLDGWRKGVAFVNEQNLGRYWPAAGPQLTLYVPAPFLQPGSNVITLLELEGAPCGPGDHCTVSLKDYPVLNGPTPDRS
ncbi:beta-galactosidase-like [Pollicipes pollicipes]|uniref:beta-galactosidase-like n=1 Tax=Pollicipes pollicipes TaxID=41117 RepID=UPI001884F142|nr:beta-galactosidase-like [Pollicipes pollicipes]